MLKNNERFFSNYKIVWEDKVRNRAISLCLKYIIFNNESKVLKSCLKWYRKIVKILAINNGINEKRSN